MAVTRLMGKSQTLTDEDSVIAAIKDVNDAVFDLMKANVAFGGIGQLWRVLLFYLIK